MESLGGGYKELSWIVGHPTGIDVLFGGCGTTTPSSPAPRPNTHMLELGAECFTMK